jgi:hypothetical protein
VTAVVEGSRKGETVAGDAEEAITRYLAAIRDPSQLQDTAELKALRERLATEDDPVDRLGIRAELELAEDVSPARYEEDFVRAARAWAVAKGVSGQAFLDEGVDARVLRRAGFAVGSKKGETGPARQSGPRRRRVSRESVAAAMPTRDAFTTRALAKRLGASWPTVRQVVRDMLEAGELEEVGLEATTRGRAAMQYRRRW